MDGAVLLRPWEARDAACVQEEKRCSREDAARWMVGQEKRRSDGAGICLAIAEAASDEALGCIGLLFRPTAGLVPTAAAGGAGLVYEPDAAMAGIGYWVIERARGRRLASTAVSLLTDWALSETGLMRVEALVEPSNVASQRVLAHAGFAHEGVLAAYLAVPAGRADALIYARTAD
jgi:[ribosomal protein S5]-alanine N-acetyltransferase